MISMTLFRRILCRMGEYPRSHRPAGRPVHGRHHPRDRQRAPAAPWNLRVWPTAAGFQLLPRSNSRFARHVSQQPSRSVIFTGSTFRSTLTLFLFFTHRICKETFKLPATTETLKTFQPFSFWCTFEDFNFVSLKAQTHNPDTRHLRHQSSMKGNFFLKILTFDFIWFLSEWHRWKKCRWIQLTKKFWVS